MKPSVEQEKVPAIDRPELEVEHVTRSGAVQCQAAGKLLLEDEMRGPAGIPVLGQRDGVMLGVERRPVARRESSVP